MSVARQYTRYGYAWNGDRWATTRDQKSALAGFTVCRYRVMIANIRRNSSAEQETNAWLRDNVKNFWTSRIFQFDIIYFFHDENDATLFKLRWG